MGRPSQATRTSTGRASQAARTSVGRPSQAARTSAGQNSAPVRHSQKFKVNLRSDSKHVSSIGNFVGPMPIGGDRSRQATTDCLQVRCGRISRRRTTRTAARRAGSPWHPLPSSRPERNICERIWVVYGTSGHLPRSMVFRVASHRWRARSIPESESFSFAMTDHMDSDAPAWPECPLGVVPKTWHGYHGGPFGYPDDASFIWEMETT